VRTPSGSHGEEELRKAARRKKLPAEGWYDDGEIEDVTETTSQNGNDVFKCTVSFTDKARETWTLTTYLLDHPKNPQTGLLLRHACAARGVLAKFEAGCVEASDLPGPARLLIRHRKQRGWPDRLEVADFAAPASSVVNLRSAG
jgi:hypothetical protein